MEARALHRWQEVAAVWREEQRVVGVAIRRVANASLLHGLLRWREVCEELCEEHRAARHALAGWVDMERLACMRLWRAYTAGRERKLVKRVVGHMVQARVSMAYGKWSMVAREMVATSTFVVEQLWVTVREDVCP